MGGTSDCICWVTLLKCGQNGVPNEEGNPRRIPASWRLGVKTFGKRQSSDMLACPNGVAACGHPGANRVASRTPDQLAAGLAHPLAPWTGFGLLCAYAVVMIGFAAWRLRRADA